MGLFDLFKGKDKNEQKKTTAKQIIKSTETPIPEDEKKYYQDNSYYTKYIPIPRMEPIKVQTFEERKKKFLPSKGGLYVAENNRNHFYLYVVFYNISVYNLVRG